MFADDTKSHRPVKDLHDLDMDATMRIGLNGSCICEVSVFSAMSGYDVYFFTSLLLYGRQGLLLSLLLLQRSAF